MNFNQLFPDDREKGDTSLRQCQLVMLRMLKILDYLCNKHEIKYFLMAGSLLGAVRHKGFIPWDDDLDVGMTRENYEKFVNKAVSELPGDIFFQTAQTDTYYPQFDYVDAKLRDKYSHYSYPEKKSNHWHEGFQVDIFVFDRSFLPHTYFIVTQNFLLKLLGKSSRRVKVVKWIAQYVPLPLVYANNFLNNFGQLNFRSIYRKKEEVRKLSKAKFEDMEASTPTDWNACLTRDYGKNYMQLPPLEKRLSHHKVGYNPFTPCEHEEVLNWKERKQS